MAEQAKIPQNKDARVYMGERFKGAEYANSDWRHRMEIGITKADLLKPEYWSHVSEHMSPYDEIKLTCDDGTVYARLLVLDCGRTWAKVQILEWYPLTTADVAQSQTNTGEQSDYTIDYKGKDRKFVIQRKSDQAVISEGEHARKEAAEAWLRDYIQGTAAKANV